MAMGDLKALITVSNILLGILTVVLAGVGYLVLFSPGKKEKDKALKEMAFDDMMGDDKGWAEEEEEEKKKAAAAKARAPGIPSTAPPTLNPAEMKVTPNSHDPSLPFQIGDRVTLQKLVGAASLNGRHGVIAAPYDKKTQRYPVDLDLFHDKPLAVKEGNILKEPAATPPADMPNVANGVLEPAHAKAAGFIFHVLRKSCQQTLQGETSPLKLSAFGWQFWKQAPNGGEVTGVYPSLLKYLTGDILKTQKLTDLDKQVSPDPNNPTKGAYQLVTKAMKSQQAVAAWNVRIEGAFWIVGMGPTGTMVVPCHNIRQVYIVVGFTAPLMAVTGGGANKFPRPPKFYLTLLPWFGVLLHDSFFCTTTGGNQVELASPNLAQELILNSKRAVAENRIITCLNQLNMQPKPNLQGVPYQPPPISANAPLPQEPATATEQALVDKLAKITKLIPPPDGLWGFVRPPGAKSFLMLNAKGEKFDEFTPNFLGEDEKDLPLQILAHILELVEKRPKNDRPAAIGVADAQTCQRLQFLCRSVPNMRVLTLNVQAKAAPGTQQEQKPVAAE